MADPFTLTAVSIGASALGGATSAIGNLMGGNSQASMFQYQSGIAAMNAQIAKQNANYAINAGEVSAQESGMKTRFREGETIARQGAGGLAIGSGSQGRVVSSEAEIGAEDQALIRSNSAKQAYGYEVTSAQDTAQSQMYGMAASNAKTAGEISAFGSILGTAGSVSSKWLQANQSGVFSSGNSASGEDI